MPVMPAICIVQSGFQLSPSPGRNPATTWLGAALGFPSHCSIYVVVVGGTCDYEAIGNVWSSTGSSQWMDGAPEVAIANWNVSLPGLAACARFSIN